MKHILIIAISLISFSVFAQNDTINNVQVNTAQRLLGSNNKLTIGGYAQIDYNQSIGDVKSLGKLDVHRLVTLFGYRFNEKTQFITEIEFEHVKEVYVEQAFLQYKINDFINFRGGLMLIPMGIVNEYHEPTTFNGVERPLVDKYVAPTTWREVGAGFTGNFTSASLKYQLYVVNGFNGYDGAGTLSGKNGLRKGRQKGAESYISTPNITGKVEYYGLKGLNVGLSGYFGNTQSVAYDGLDMSNDTLVASADSSVVGVSMIGADFRYTRKGLQLRGQYYINTLSNTDQYNAFTGSNLGSSITGYYFEAGYNIFQGMKKMKTDLIAFARYEQYNTHNTVAGDLVKNKAYNNNIITTGLTWKMSPGACLKVDAQFIKPESNKDYSTTINAGVGVMF